MFGGTKCSCMFCIFISHLVICNCNPLGVTSPPIEKHLSRHFKPQALILNNETKGITSNLIKNGKSGSEIELNGINKKDN